MVNEQKQELGRALGGLKRAYAVADMTRVPLDAPVELDFQLEIVVVDRVDDTTSSTTTSTTTTYPLSISSTATLKLLKMQIEPHVYHAFRAHVDALGVGSDYWVRPGSPSRMNALSPTSDYGSDAEGEFGLDVDGDGHAVFGNPYNAMINRSMHFRLDESERWLQDSDYMYELRACHRGVIRCLVDLSTLRYQQ